MPHKTRILFCVLADHDNVNAQSLNARDIALRLNPERFESTLFYAGEPDPRLPRRPSIRLIKLPPRLKSVVIARHMIWGKYEILFYPPYDYRMRWYDALVALGRRKQIVSPVEGPIDYIRQESPDAFGILLSTLRTSAMVVPLSDFAAEVLAREAGLKPACIIPVGVDTRFFTPVSRAKRHPVQVLFVGRLIRRKGPDRVLEAARTFPEAHFQLAGSAYGTDDGAFAQELVAQVRESGLTNVEFLGSVSRVAIRQLLWNSDILLHPSRVDGIPKVTMEAAATGLPCIVFDDYQTPSVVDGVTGFQVKTLPEMLERLRLLIADSDLRRRMGEAGAEHAKQFDWDVVVKEWEKAFGELTDARA